eukprot:3824964-Rhodomonas_salina.6
MARALAQEFRLSRLTTFECSRPSSLSRDARSTAPPRARVSATCSHVLSRAVTCCNVTMFMCMQREEEGSGRNGVSSQRAERRDGNRTFWGAGEEES